MQRAFPLLFVSIFIVVSCQGDWEQKLPDVSGNQPDFELYRFDQEFGNLDTTDASLGLNELKFKYPVFTNLYLQSVLLMVGDSVGPAVSHFLKDERISLLHDTTNMIIGNLDQVKEEISEAYQYFMYHFPQRDVPNIYTFISEYAYQTFIFEDANGRDCIGVGLDMFLGNGYPYRSIIPNNPAFSEYLTRTFNKEHMAKKILETQLSDIMGEARGNTLLDKMIHNGKKIYMLDNILPFVSDTIIMDYNKEQFDWCVDNELEMWGYLFSENLFYSNDLKKINKLVNPSPHSSGMPSAAPGRTANYIGWQIIKAYMRRFPETTFEDLINMQDGQEILEKSKYKPRGN